MMPSTSRRAVIVSLAAIPTITTTTATMSVTVAGDAIFAAIERYRHACAALDSADQRGELAQYDAAERELFVSSEALWATPPQTIEGATALVDFVLEDVVLGNEGDWACRALASLSEALPRMAVQQST